MKNRAKFVLGSHIPMTMERGPSEALSPKFRNLDIE